jgi:hypothetical protein
MVLADRALRDEFLTERLADLSPAEVDILRRSPAAWPVQPASVEPVAS